MKNEKDTTRPKNKFSSNFRFGCIDVILSIKNEVSTDVDTCTHDYLQYYCAVELRLNDSRN